MIPVVFCPTCGELILAQPACPACGWRRPVEPEGAGQAAWCADLGTRLIKPHCYPIVAAGRYCLGTEDGLLLGIDLASGQVAWEQRLDPGSMAHALATDGERLFAGGEDVQTIPTPGKALLALDARSGGELWRYATRAHSLSAPAVAEGAVYVAASDGRLHAVDAGSGQQRWTAEHPAWGPAAPAAGEGLVCAGGRGTELVAYAAADGAVQWHFSAANWFATRPTIDGGAVYALCWDDHLYALDAHTGRLRWKLTGERGKGFTSPPAVAGGCLFIGSRAYRQVEGQQAAGYALLALDGADGREVWRFYAERHITAPPAAAEGLVFFGAGDGAFYALDAASGEEQWRMQVKSRAVAQPQVAGDLVLFGGRDGMVYAVRWRARSPELPSAQEYEQQGQHAEAAAAYALQGDLERAATIYVDILDRPREAARLYERAGKFSQAAGLWARVGDLHRARDLYRQTGDRLGLAGVLVHMGELLSAARLYEEEGRLDEAARLYEQASDRGKAADLYDRLGWRDKAQSLWDSLGWWEKSVEAYIAEGKPTEAARLLEEHEQWERAADLYETAELWPQALAIRVRLGHWDRVADLAPRAGDYEQLAQAQERLGHPELAAEACEQAAEQLLAAQPADEARVAGLYERAERLYGGMFDEDKAASCHRRVLEHRRLPQVVVSGKAREEFMEHEWNTLDLKVENTGFGPARNIRITFSDKFEVGDPVQVSGLPAGKARPLKVEVRPREGEYGRTVPLKIAVTYGDLRGGQHEAAVSLSVHVVQKGILPGVTTPVAINIGEYYQPGARRIEGHEVQAGGQVGDRVGVYRNGSRRQVLESCDVGNQVRREGPPVRRCPACNLPIQAPDYRHCPDCGARLDEEAS